LLARDEFASSELISRISWFGLFLRQALTLTLLPKGEGILMCRVTVVSWPVNNSIISTVFVVELSRRSSCPNFSANLVVWLTDPLVCDISIQFIPTLDELRSNQFWRTNSAHF
jgi:hypothetical protein